MCKGPLQLFLLPPIFLQWRETSPAHPSPCSHCIPLSILLSLCAQALLSLSLHLALNFITPIASSFFFFFFPSGWDERADESALFLIHVNSPYSPFAEASPPAALG